MACSVRVVLAYCRGPLSAVGTRLGKLASLHICPGYRMSQISEAAPQIDYHLRCTCQYCDGTGPRRCDLYANGEDLVSRRDAVVSLEKIDSCRSFFQLPAVDFVRLEGTLEIPSLLCWECRSSWKCSQLNFGDAQEAEVDVAPPLPEHSQVRPQPRGG